MTNIIISDEVRDILSQGLTKIDDKVLHAAITLSPIKDGTIEVQPHIVEAILAQISECISNFVQEYSN